VVAGRTDRDVSAVSQIINFLSSTNETEEDFVNKVNDLMSSQKGHLKVYDCQRVPRKFNARYLILLFITVSIITIKNK